MVNLNAKIIERWEKEGRGTGKGRDYKRWLNHSDVPKKQGMHVRVPCLSQDGMQKDLFSMIEGRSFKVADLSEFVTDIREQFKLPTSLTLIAAAEAGVKHPVNVQDQSTYVMTTDLVLTLVDGTDIAIDVKESSAFTNMRTLEKLEIVRRTWKKIGSPWFLCTEKEVTETLYKTVNIVHAHALTAHKRETDNPDDFRVIGNLVYNALAANPEEALANACDTIDVEHSLSPGTALMHALAMFNTRRLAPDWNLSYESQIVRSLLDRASTRQHSIRAAS